MNEYLVIFDCDGVLVDSERLAIQIDREALQKIGVHLTEAEIISKFVGKSDEYFETEIRKICKDEVPDNWFLELRNKYSDVFKEKLKPIPGIEEVLKSLTNTKCVASSGSVAKSINSLKLTNLDKYFDKNIFSSTQVANGKPSPDLFLFAAETMGFEPVNCIVVEDSVAGLQGALAAGMQAIAFTGSVTPAKDLMIPGVNLLESMPDLLEIIATIRR